eukprot:8203305-Alexandrium_andersonii.AAC.1
MLQLQRGHLATETGDWTGGPQLLLHGTRIGVPTEVAHGPEWSAHWGHDCHKHTHRGEVLQDSRLILSP